MSVVDTMRALKPRIEELLRTKQHLRDNDYRLIANVWSREVPIPEMSAHKFLLKFAAGNLSNPESIRRVRQKLQEENPSLRGEKWRLRHAEAEVVRSEIRDL